MDIQEKVISIISDELSVKIEDVKLDSELIQDLEIDELDNIELCMALEEEFGIEIPDEDIEEFKTVKDIVEYVKEKKGGG